MKRIALLITILLSSIKGFAQPHPRDKEIAAAIRAYFNADTNTIIEDFTYLESIDISEQEYTNMASSTFETYMTFAKNVIAGNDEKQKKYQEKKSKLIKTSEQYKKYDDSLSQLLVYNSELEVMLRKNKVSLDSCKAVAKKADTASNFGYLSYVRLTYKDKSIPGFILKKEIEEFIVTKDLEVHLYMRPEND